MSFFSDVGEEFLSLMAAIGRFLGIVGPTGFRVATDILTQVEQGGTTPQQVGATAADLYQFIEAVKRAASASKLAAGVSTDSVITPALTPEIAAQLQSGG